MECPSPSANNQFFKNIKSYRKRRRHTSNGKYMDSYLTLKIGFIMDSVASVRDLEKHLKVLQSQIVYVQDPKYFQFPNTVKSYKGDTLVIEVCVINIVSHYYKSLTNQLSCFRSMLFIIFSFKTIKIYRV